MASARLVEVPTKQSPQKWKKEERGDAEEEIERAEKATTYTGGIRVTKKLLCDLKGGA